MTAEILPPIKLVSKQQIITVGRNLLENYPIEKAVDLLKE
jgi:hypothetical protein